MHRPFFACLCLLLCTPLAASPQHDFGPVELLTLTEGVELAPYFSRFIEKIRGNLYAGMPDSARQGTAGEVVVQFRLLRDGGISEPSLVLSSGKTDLDQAALAATTASSPLDPLPGQFTGPFLELRIRFLYNTPVRPARNSPREVFQRSQDAGTAPAPSVKIEVVAEADVDLSAYVSRLNGLVSGYANAAIAGITESGEVRVRFPVRRDGIAQKPVISLSSSRQALDEAALKAVSDSMARVEPLPAEVTRSFVDFQVRFLFNQVEAPKQEPLSLADIARKRAKRSSESDKKVFTNDEVSTASEPEPTTARKGSSSSSSTSGKEKSSTGSKSEKSEKPPEQDPEHYRQRLQPLREQLSEVKVEIDRVRYTPAERTAGLPTISNTQQNEIERLQRKKADLEKRIAAICDEASRNNVSVSSCSYY